MRTVVAVLAAGVSILAASTCIAGETGPDPLELRPGGAATGAGSPDRLAFSRPVPELTLAEGLDFRMGRSVFEKLWVPSPSSTFASDGLGPRFDANACSACHVRGGRGDAPDRDLARLAVKLVGEADGARFGSQLQRHAVPGLALKAEVDLSWSETRVTLAGGETVTLRKPLLAVRQDGSDGTPPRLSPRLAPPLAGMGLIEAIPVTAIEAGADPDDRDGDGISGRVSRVTDSTGKIALGRFGWTAAEASLRGQIAAAFSVDMGLSTSLHPDPWGDCVADDTGCRAFPTGVQSSQGAYEVPDALLDLVVYQARLTAVPARKKPDGSEALKGREDFRNLGCTACHRPSFVTGTALDPRLSGQTIWPYSDFLLHDMGNGLSDGRQPAEWRTPPLWAIGHSTAANPKGGYLHDGRARDLTEAILWHGGEAEASRNRFMNAPVAVRTAVLGFLLSL